MLLEHALSTVCSEICLQLGASVAQATQAVRLTQGTISCDALATWLVSDTHMFTLIKCGSSTLAYCHSNKTLFYAKPEFMLRPTTPDGHAFLAQIAEDRADGGKHSAIPRLLVMDLIYPRILEPNARYKRLLQLSPLCLPETCVLQWAGQPKALREFLQNGLPHDVSGIVAFGAPLSFTKELNVAVGSKRRASSPSDEDHKQ